MGQSGVKGLEEPEGGQIGCWRLTKANITAPDHGRKIELGKPHSLSARYRSNIPLKEGLSARYRPNLNFYRPNGKSLWPIF